MSATCRWCGTAQKVARRSERLCQLCDEWLHDPKRRTRAPDGIEIRSDFPDWRKDPWRTVEG